MRVSQEQLNLDRQRQEAALVKVEQEERAGLHGRLAQAWRIAVDQMQAREAYGEA